MALLLDKDFITLEMFKGEGKPLPFQFTFNGSPLDLSGATFFLGAKRKLDDSNYLFSYADDAFDKSQATNGKVSVMLQPQDTRLAPLSIKEEIYLQLKTTFPSGGEVDLSHIIRLVLHATVIGD